MDYELFNGSLQISFSASVVQSNSIVSRNNTNFFAKYQPTEFPWHLMLQQDTSCVLGSVGKTIFLIVHCWIICAVLFFISFVSPGWAVSDDWEHISVSSLIRQCWYLFFFFDASNMIWENGEVHYLHKKKSTHFFNSSCLWQSYHLTKLPTWHIKVE